VLSAGVVIAHRAEAEDAEVIAAQFGTHTTTNLTSQVNYQRGESEKGSVRWVEEFDVHPNVLKALLTGFGALLVRRTAKKTVVRITPPM
jgi:hypothetical protein